MADESHTTGWRAILARGPNAQGWVVLILFSWMSIANRSPWPILFLIGVSVVPPLLFYIWERYNQHG